jgi:hypothetical protein
MQAKCRVAMYSDRHNAAWFNSNILNKDFYLNFLSF